LITYRLDNSRTVTKSPDSSEMMLLEWKTGYLGNKWFSQRRFFEYDPKTQVRRYAEPLINVVRGEAVVEYRAGHKSAVVDKTELGRNTYRDLDYFSNLSLDAPKYVAKSLGLQDKLGDIRREFASYADLPFLPDFLSRNISKYSVLPEKETIDGTPCRVVEWKGKDRIWVDEATLVIRRRKYSWNSNTSARIDITNFDFQEVKPGLSLPFRQIATIYFDPSITPKLADKVRFVATYIVEDIKFDSLDDNFFEIALPTGTAVFDAPRGFTYVVSDSSSDPFTASITKAKSELLGTSGSGRMMSRWLIGLNIAVAIGGIGFWLFRRFRNEVTQ
jgi:outer membrane lipoprotein-sorting protein